MSERQVTGPDSWSVEAAPPFLRSILDGLAQGIWVIDPEARVRFANPAAAETLGYDDVSELLGRHSHNTIHYKRPDGTPFPIEECRLMLPLRTGETVRGRDWFVRRDGSMVPVAYWSAPLEMDEGRGAVTAFSDIAEHLRLEAAERERDLAEAREAEARAGRRRILETADAVRRRLTRDLHDGAQQRFVMAAISLQLAQGKWSSDPRRAKELLDEAAEQLIEGVDELRDFAADVHPSILADRGLAAAIEALASRMPLPVSLDVEDVDLPPQVETDLYFFVSEGLTNIVKHANASEAGIRVAVEDGRLLVEVRDDGSDDIDTTGGGSGLASLRDRVDALDGELQITSRPSVGTILHAEIPLP